MVINMKKYILISLLCVSCSPVPQENAKPKTDTQAISQNVSDVLETAIMWGLK